MEDRWPLDTEMSNQPKIERAVRAQPSYYKLFLILVVAFSLVASSTLAQEQDLSVEELLSGVLEELNAKQNWIGQADKRIQDLLAALRTSDQKVASAASRIAEIQASITRLEQSLDDQEKRSQEITNKISSLSSSIALHIRVAHRLQRKHWLRSFLEQENAERNDRHVRYHRYFANSKSKSIEEFEELLGEMRRVSESILNDRNSLAEQKDEWTNEKATYDQESKARKEQISELNSEIATTQRDVDKLLEDRGRLESLLAEIERIGIDSTSQSGSEGSVTEESSKSWPIEGEILVEFGDPRADGRLKWQGVHIAAATGTDVVAVAPGKVVFADWLMGFGMMLILDHGDEVLTVYGYCDTLLARTGDFVEAGEIIATVGQSGGQTTPGLYFEVRSNGSSTDPIKWLGKSNSTD